MLSRTSVAVAVVVLVFFAGPRREARGGFMFGEFVTHSQDGWGGNPAVPGSAAALISEKFFFIYPGGGVLVGSTRSMLFTGPTPVLNYLPTSGANAPLSATLVDPTSTASGAFGGHVL